MALLLILSSCGNEDFSPTYHESPCVAAAELSFLDLPAEDNPSSSNSCCQASGLVSCCFGGNFICADGTSGVGCGCPTN